MAGNLARLTAGSTPLTISPSDLDTSVESLERLAERLTFLSEAGRTLSSSIDYEQTFKSLSRLIVPKVADWFVLDLLQPDGEIERVASLHVDPAFNQQVEKMKRLSRPPKEASTWMPYVLKTRSAILQDKIDESDFAELEREGWDRDWVQLIRNMKPVSIMIVPMVLEHGKTIGGIAFFTTVASNRKFDMEDLHLAHELAALASRAVSNATLYREAVNEAQRMQILQRMRLQYVRKHIHDMRAPLTAVNLLTDLVSRKCHDPDQVLKIAKRMQENIARVTHMLEDIPVILKSEESRGPRPI